MPEAPRGMEALVAVGTVVTSLDRCNTTSSATSSTTSSTTDELLQACRTRDEEKVKFVLDKCDRLPDNPDAVREVLQYACAVDSVRVLSGLVCKGLDLHAPLAPADYPLHTAVSAAPPGTFSVAPPGSFSAPGTFSVVREMVDAGCDVNVIRRVSESSDSFCEFSPLTLAIEKQNLPLVKYLLERGADLHVKLKHTSGCVHCVPLDVAVRTRNKAITALLLHHGADVNYLLGVGYSPLHLAVLKHDLELVRMLLEAGADPNADDKYGTPVLQYLFLSSPMGDVLPVKNPGQICNIRKLYLSRCVEFKEKRRRDFCESICPETVVSILTALLQGGADPNNETCGCLTAGHVVTGRNAAEIYRILLKFGWSVWSADYQEQTALHHLAAGNDTDAMRLLVENGGNINAKDANGRSVLHHLAMDWYKPYVGLVYDNLRQLGKLREFTDAKVKVIEYILDLGVDPNATDGKKDESALYRLCLHPLYAGAVRWLLWQPGVKLPVVSILRHIRKSYHRLKTLRPVLLDLLRAGAEADFRIYTSCTPLEHECAVIRNDDDILVPVPRDAREMWTREGVCERGRRLAGRVPAPGLDLRGWAVLAVRNALQSAAPGYTILPAISTLPVPFAVKEQLSLEHIAEALYT